MSASPLWKKLLPAAAGLFVVLCLGLYVWVRTILSGDMVRTALAAQISRAIGQPVAIGGVNAAVFPRVAATLTNVRIGSASEISVETLTLDTDFRGLLSRRIEHAVIRVNGARINLPLPPLSFGSAAAAPDTSSPGSPVGIVSVDEIVLKDIEISSGGRTLKGDINVVPQGRGLLVKSVRLAAGDMTLSATGVVTDLTGPVGELKLTAGVLNIDDLIAFASDFARGVGQIDALSRTSPGANAAAASMNMTATVQADRATVGRLTIEKLTARAKATATLLTVDPLAFGLFDGWYNGALDVTLGGNARNYRWSATVSDINVAAAAAVAGIPDTISGVLTGRVDLAGQGADAATAMRTVRGSARIDVVNGVVKNLGLVRSVGAATELSLDGLRHAAVGVADTSEPFTRLGATVGLANREATTDDLWFDAEDIAFFARGTLQLDARAMNLKGRLELSEALSAQVARKMLRLSKDNGRVVLPATITGPVGAPVVRVDTADITRRALRNAATEHTPNLIKKGVGGLLRR